MYTDEVLDIINKLEASSSCIMPVISVSNIRDSIKGAKIELYNYNDHESVMTFECIDSQRALLVWRII